MRILKYKAFETLQSRYGEYVAKKEKESDEESRTKYRPDEKDVVRRLAKLVRQEVLNERDTLKGRGWYAEVSDRLSLEEIADRLDVRVSDVDGWALEVTVNVTDPMLRNMIMDHLLERVEDLDKAANREFGIDTGRLIDADAHWFDHDGNSKLVVSDDKLRALMKLMTK